MGKLIIFAKYVLFVFSSDINESRRHIHVRDRSSKLNNLCKFWIEPKIEIAQTLGFNKTELNEIRKLIIIHKELINSQLDKFYAGKKIKSIDLQES